MPWALLGLDQVKASLTDMLRQERVPHAILLTGPAGSGKMSMSLALAQALNCQSPDPDFSPCLDCESCRKIRALTHPDLLVLEPQGRMGVIPIDEIRALRGVLGLTPYEGKSQVAILRSVERFKEESGGALLKTLEEPSSSVFIILNALSEAAVMPTLVSRCSRLALAPPPRRLLISALAERGRSGAQAALLAGLSGGAMGAALEMDAAAAEAAYFGLDAVLGLSGRPGALSAAIRWTKELSEEIAKLKKMEQAWPRTRALLDLMVSSLRLWHRDVAALAATGDPAALLGPPATSAQWAWSKTLSAKKSRLFELSVERLAAGLARELRLEIVFENFWLAVLEYQG
jgi:DNA polymerase III delta' subunit